MSYTLSGSAATRMQGYVTTNAELGASLGVEYTEDQANQPVLVLEDTGNQLAYIIEGSLVEMADLLDQARDAVTVAMAESELPPVPEILQGLVAPGEDYWTTDQMRELFTVEGFAAPFVLVRRKADGMAGSLMFSHQPRYYHSWVEGN